jgi:hypothetical protein
MLQTSTPQRRGNPQMVSGEALMAFWIFLEPQTAEQAYQPRLRYLRCKDRFISENPHVAAGNIP